MSAAREERDRERDDRRDSELVRAIAAGDRQALKRLYYDYHGRLTRFLMRLAPRYDLAEEVINETFWIVWRRAADFRGAARVSTWIMGIAWRCAMKVMRRRSQDTPLDEEAALDRATDDAAQAHEQAEWLSAGLAQLPLEQRVTLELAYYLGHSCEEIAAIMTCNVNTVKARMFHARQKLKRTLPALGGGREVDA